MQKADPDREIECSSNSQTSTKAHYTKDINSNYEMEFAFESHRDESDNQIEELGLLEPVEVAPKKDILPRLDQVFSNADAGFMPKLFSNAPVTQAPTMIAPLKVSQQTECPVKAQESTLNEPSVDLNKEIDFLTAKIDAEKPKPAKKDLSIRPDVVHKTILRSMKRYYNTEFETFTGFGAMPDKQRYAEFQQLIRKFVMAEFKSLNGLSEQQIEDTIFFFGSLISHVHMRRGIKVSKQRTQVNFVHKCLYNYSSKKLAQLMAFEGFEHVIRDFIQFGGIDVVIQGEETLAKNQDVYKTAAEELLLKCQQE